LSDTVEITVPVARSIKPVTGTNWEGPGVTPDIEASAEESFNLSYRKALEHVAAESKTPAIAEEAQETLSGLV
jgi:C-terminal processing protease CtpA/Prc